MRKPVTSSCPRANANPAHEDEWCGLWLDPVTVIASRNGTFNDADAITQLVNEVNQALGNSPSSSILSTHSSSLTDILAYVLSAESGIATGFSLGAKVLQAEKISSGFARSADGLSILGVAVYGYSLYNQTQEGKSITTGQGVDFVTNATITTAAGLADAAAWLGGAGIIATEATFLGLTAPVWGTGLAIVGGGLVIGEGISIIFTGQSIGQHLFDP